jgi:hypothetical protein
MPPKKPKKRSPNWGGARPGSGKKAKDPEGPRVKKQVVFRARHVAALAEAVKQGVAANQSEVVAQALDEYLPSRLKGAP